MGNFPKKIETFLNYFIEKGGYITVIEGLKHTAMIAVIGLLIGIVTLFICFAGIAIGKKAGTKLAGKAGIFGGAILIFIGLEIFITSWF